MKRLILAVLILALCAGLAHGETREDIYWRLHRERNATTRYGAPPTAATNSIPAGLRLLEYVESTGEQYVDTGFVCTPESRLEADFEFTQVSTKQQRVFEQYASAGSLFFALYINGSGNIGWAWANTPAQWKSVSIAISARRRIYILDGPELRFSVGSTSRSLPDVEISEPGTATARLGAPGVKQPYGKWYSATIHHAGVLVRDFRPVKDAAGVAGLLDMVSGKIFYSATSTPLVAGPELRPATVLPTVSRETVREMLTPAPTGEPPELAGGDLWLDCLAIPEGTWLCECPIDGTTNTAWRAALCPSNILRAVVWRHATGIAPTNLPVTLEHDSSRVIGRIERLFYEAGTGVVARISITQAGYDWARSNRCDRPSPDVRATYTNLIVRSDGWRYEHQDYLDSVVVPMLRDYGTRPEHAAELASFANLTNVPASTPCLVMAPIYLRGLSLVSLPLLPTYIEYRVPDHLRDAYPIRPPRQWDWRR